MRIDQSVCTLEVNVNLKKCFKILNRLQLAPPF
uniref:BLTX315 n=1 Tax=Nephila pilipes TaxID=299642 RepID=A0A076KZW4_NEPPI|nr:BLTX315 [Nephila pilipes]